MLVNDTVCPTRGDEGVKLILAVRPAVEKDETAIFSDFITV